MAGQPTRESARKVAQSDDAAARAHSVERKRRWRRDNPERYRVAERERKRRSRARARARGAGAPSDQLRLET
jgi:hypothetical protein